MWKYRLHKRPLCQKHQRASAVQDASHDFDSRPYLRKLLGRASPLALKERSVLQQLLVSLLSVRHLRVLPSPISSGHK